ncbi:glutathione S-transferase family protein [Stenotrophomonas sp. ISL-67]|uniref:glutathione S-transferase family protein n=1 Tax=Stenotrophomonas sp. ISL-67 TaxID=2819171 RepID=UPI001BEBCCEB|nr:glutathione S-transferase family protein [Stenotrophomonas sp. ISL-67]MBT2766467.1 glutathione S-transferase family protein [Stenotrophomonas sp. ISL-67]
MALPILHAHPLSSCCQKVLIAARVLGVALDERLLNLGDPAEREMLQALSPAEKMPVLVDQGRAVAETSIIIEYLQQHLAGGPRLIPTDADAALAVRFWDRFSDFYVMTPMQALTAELLKPESGRSGDAAEAARSQLLNSYAAMNRQLEDRTWLAGEGFSMADCAAAPALFYAVAYVPIPEKDVHLLAYVARLMAHPAVAAVVDAARPWFKYFPGRAGLSARFYLPEA